jgi:hypothetical protein
MSQKKYVGMDVHQATISVAVLDSRARQVFDTVGQRKELRYGSLEMSLFLRGTVHESFPFRSIPLFFITLFLLRRHAAVRTGLHEK